MTATEPLTLDVRDELRSGGEPLPRILRTVGELEPGRPLRLLATFEPIPLYSVLGRKGFGHTAIRHGEGDWEILFTPGQPPAAAKARQSSTAAPSSSSSGADWPLPATYLDNRGLGPPEPMIRILGALEHLPPGGVLEALNEREPMFLYPELEARGAMIQVQKQTDGTVRLLIRRGAER